MAELLANIFRRLPFALLTVGALMLVVVGCDRGAERDPCNPSDLTGCVLEEVDVKSAGEVDDDEVKEHIATAESNHALGGIFEGVPIVGLLDTLSVEYERFDRFVLERDLERVRRYYRRKGYYEAVVSAGRVLRLPEQRVRVEVVVEAGEPVLIREVELDWVDWRLPEAGPVTLGIIGVQSSFKKGDVLDEDAYDDAKKRMLRVLTDGGFAYASVEGSVEVDLKTRSADVVIRPRLGPKCTFGPITIEGLGEIPEGRVRRVIGFQEGDQFSTDAIESAESALAEFGVFGSTEFTTKQSPKGEPENPIVPVHLKVLVTELRTVKAGIGAEVGDRVELHVLAGWEDRNVFRLLDRFSIEVQPGLVIYPLRFNTLAQEPQFLEVLPTVRVRSQYRLPVPYLPRTTFYTQGEVNVGRPDNADTPEDPSRFEPILGYYEYVGRFGLERRFFKSVLLVSPSYNIQVEVPFSYNSEPLAPGFRDILISNLKLFVELDMRRNSKGKLDRINPNRGFYLANDLQFAGRFLGGSADDVRVKPEARGYLGITRRVTLAARLVTGLLFADNYGVVLDNADSIDDLRPDGDDVRRAALNYDRQLLEFRGFFGGGPYSNRGYTFGEIGPHAVLDFDGITLDEPDSVGGRTMWEASLEVRYPLVGDLAGVSFVDAGDVTGELGQYRLTHPHVAAGFGLRYITPFGPLRFDLGYRIPYLQVIGEPSVESCLALNQVCPALVIDEGDPGELLGLPVAISIAVGEAF